LDGTGGLGNVISVVRTSDGANGETFVATTTTTTAAAAAAAAAAGNNVSDWRRRSRGR